MNFATQLAERLTALAPARGVADWRLVVDTGTSTELGLKDNHLGGPYDAPNQVSGTRGEVYLRWTDGRVSSGVVDRTTLENLDEDLALWRQAAYEDAYAPDVLGPQAVPDVPLYDAEVARLTHADHGPLFALLERVRAELPAYEAERVSGSITVATQARRLLTSRGLDLASESTSCGAYADIDHRAHDYVSLRRFPNAEEVTRMITRAGEANRLLKRPAKLRSGRLPVVFTPSTTESFLSKFLLTNLDGQRVLNGQSAFALEQFRAHEALFHPTLGLEVDPLKPLSPGSYGFTREGLPAREVALIREGRLLTPLLDLKHAKRAEMAPTPFPRGGSSLRLTGPTVPYEQLIAELDSALVVYEMLGLHTQDSSRGNFSLTVSQGLVVEKGAIVGQTKAIIAGNVFAALQHPFRLGRQEGREVPALQIEADVTVS